MCIIARNAQTTDIYPMSIATVIAMVIYMTNMLKWEMYYIQ